MNNFELYGVYQEPFCFNSFTSEICSSTDAFMPSRRFCCRPITWEMPFNIQRQGIGGVQVEKEKWKQCARILSLCGSKTSSQLSTNHRA
jgi:hypothetical protein